MLALILTKEKEMSSAKEVWKILAETNQKLKETGQKLQETSEKIRENSAETSRQIQENSAEVSRKMKEGSAETDRKLQETGEKIRELSAEIKEAKELFETQWGKLMESLVEGDLVKILQDRSIDVQNTYPNVSHRSKEDQYEYDIIVENGEEVVVVEVKTTLKVKHVKHFLENLKKVPRRLRSFRGRIIYGAVAYLKADEESAIYAEKQGLFVIRATGSSASLINKQDFKPKSFS